MKVIVCNPYHRPRVEEIGNDLPALQEIVGGYIEIIGIGPGAVIVCDEEGKLKGKPYNRFLWQDGRIADVLVGSFLICGVDGCDLCSLTDEQISEYTERFMIPDFTRGG